MQSSPRIRRSNVYRSEIGWNDSVEKETDFEHCSCISHRRVYFAVELDERPVSDRRSRQPRTTEHWKVCCSTVTELR